MRFPRRYLIALLGAVAPLCVTTLLAAQQAADPLRERLIAQARDRSPTLAAYRAAVRSAEATATAAGARAAPILGVEIEEVPDGRIWDAGQAQLSLEQELFTGRRRRTSTALAAIEVRRAEVLLALAERTMAGEIDRHLAEWRGERAIDQRLVLEESLLAQVEEGLAARLAAGEGRYVDVLRIRSERLRVQTDRAESLRLAQRARTRLLSLTGDSSLPVESAEPGNPAALPELRAVDSLLAEVEVLGLFALAESVAVLHARQLNAERGPRVIGGVGVQRFGEPGAFKMGPALHASISLPMAVGGSNRAVAEAGRAGIGRAAAESDAARARLRVELRESRDNYLAARERAELFDRALLAGSRVEREAALDAYRSGGLTLLELLDFERALARAEIEQARARMAAWKAWAALLTPASLTVPEGGHDD